jgi:hypothetical protein
MLYCPKCGAEALDGQHYCRQCGANLTLVSKAVTLGDAINRTGSGPLPKIKSLIGNLKLDRVSEEVGRGLDQMNQEIEQSMKSVHAGVFWAPWTKREPKTPDERRAELFAQGVPALLSGVGLMIVLYYFASVLVLRIPPEIAARVPFEIEPLARMAWLLGLVPALSGLGRIIAALAIRPTSTVPLPLEPPVERELGEPDTPLSVTEATTRTLETPAGHRPPDARVKH